MARLMRSVISAMAVVVFVVSLLLLYKTRVSVRERDEQVQRLRERVAQLEDDVTRLPSTFPMGLTHDELEAYLSLPYKEFDATPGSGFRRFRDQPRDLAQTGALIEAYIERHADLPVNQRKYLLGHAAQLYAMGGMYERAIFHLERLRAQDPENSFASAFKAFLLSDRVGLLAARRQMTNGVEAEMVDLLIEHFGESCFDAWSWGPICSTVSVPVGASAEHRAIADQLAQLLGRTFTVTHDPPAEGGIPGNCIWLEVRPMGGTPDVEGYFILNALKRTVITATSEQRLATAVKRFIDSFRQHDGKRQVPFGLTTSFVLAR